MPDDEKAPEEKPQHRRSRNPRQARENDSRQATDNDSREGKDNDSRQGKDKDSRQATDNDSREGKDNDSRQGTANKDGRVSAAAAAAAGLSNLRELTGKQPEGVTAVERTDDGWRVGVEVLEDQRIPSSADILAIYETDLDSHGELLSYRRTRRYPRGRADDRGDY